jgi:hypothetical protein
VDSVNLDSSSPTKPRDKLQDVVGLVLQIRTNASGRLYIPSAFIKDNPLEYVF